MPLTPARRREACVRTESLALNLPDLLRVDPFVRQQLLVGKLDTTTPLVVDPRRGDEVAAVCTCDLLTAACLADVLRAHDRRAGAPPCRVYLRRLAGGAWVRLPADARLTEVVGDRPVLAPDLFPTVLELAPTVPPPPKPAPLLGRRTV